VDQWTVDADDTKVFDTSENSESLILDALTNNGFETGDGTGWTLGSGSVESNNPHSGTYSYEEAASDYWMGQTLSSPVDISDIVEVSVWVYQDYQSSRSIAMQFTYGDSSTEYNFETVANDTWTKLEYTSYLDSGKDNLTKIEVYCNCAGNLVLDDFTLTYTPEPTNFITDSLNIVGLNSDLTIDSYGTENDDVDYSLKGIHPSNDSDSSCLGQTFSPPHKFNLTSADFYLQKAGSPSGNAKVVLYAITGTHGTDATPSGSALAESDTLNVSSLTTSAALYTFNFSGYVLDPETNYAIVFQNPTSGTIDSSNYVKGNGDTSSATHSGNAFRYNNGDWDTTYAAYDAVFYVYGHILPEILGDGAFSYDVQLQYEYDSSESIDSGVVRLLHSNGTYLSTDFSTNSSGWTTITMDQVNGSLYGTYTLYPYSEPNYEITYPSGNQTFEILIFRGSIKDSAGTLTKITRTGTDFDINIDGSDFIETETCLLEDGEVDYSGTTVNSPDYYTPPIFIPNATSPNVVITTGNNHILRDYTFTSPITDASNSYVFYTSFHLLEASDSYALISMNNTYSGTYPNWMNATPTISENNIVISGVSESSENEILFDVANWLKSDQPYRFEVDTSQYNQGDGTWGWNDETRVFTFTYPFSGSNDISLIWGEDETTGSSGSPSSGGPSGPSTGYTPEEGGEVPEETTGPEGWQEQPFDIPEDTRILTFEQSVLGVAAIFLIIAVIIVYKRTRKKDVKALYSDMINVKPKKRKRKTEIKMSMVTKIGIAIIVLLLLVFVVSNLIYGGFNF
jgi:hypothetical protein